MKKLIIAIGAILSIMAVNAGSIDWTIEGAYAPGTEDDMGASYYAFIIADSGTGESATYSRDLALESLAAGDLSFVDTYAITDAEAFEDGYAAQFNIGDFVPNQTVTAYAIILDADNVSDATKAFITALGKTDLSGMGAGPTIEFGDISDATGDIDNWYAVTAGGSSGGGDVPEPTSGLLLMLGVAGMALRRKVK